MEEKLIYKKLAAINSEVEAIGKDRKNEQQGFKFRGIDDVMNALHFSFAKNEVVILPEVLTYERSERQNTKGTAIFSILAKIKYTFVAPDGSSVSSIVVGEAMDSGDKGMNKALSIALKYVLLQMFLIPTEEEKDPDSQTHEVKPQPKKQLTPANIEAWNAAKKYLKEGGRIDAIEAKYQMTKENREQLITESI